MDRRELLRMIALVTGGAVIGGELFLSGCSSGTGTAAGFTEANVALLDEVGETILPATSSPGAREARVGQFMKFYVNECYNQASRNAFLAGLVSLEQSSRKLNGKGFMDSSPEQKKELLLQLEKEARDFNSSQDKADAPALDELQKKNLAYQFVPSPLHYYTMIKQLTLLGFFTSEIGATKALRYIAVPGRYDGDVPYKKGERSWATD